MRKSCGALLYAFDVNGRVGVILGLEDKHWFVFKGCPEQGEDIRAAAIREVYEETNKLVKLESIEITYIRKTNHKEYHIGLCEVPYSIVDTFNSLDRSGLDAKYIEKKELRFFTIDEALFNGKVHNITKDTIIRYMDNLQLLDKYKSLISCKMRRQSVSIAYAVERYKKLSCVAEHKSLINVKQETDETSDAELQDDLYIRPTYIKKKKNNPFRLFNCTAEETISKAKKMTLPWRTTIR